MKLSTIRGNIEVSFRNKPEGDFELTVSVPANMTADIYLPNKYSKAVVTMNGNPIAFLKMKNSLIVKDIGSGLKSFTVSE